MTKDDRPEELVKFMRNLHNALLENVAGKAAKNFEKVINLDLYDEGVDGKFTLKENTDSKILNAQINASEKVLQAGGILPTSNQSIYIQQTINNTQVNMFPSERAKEVIMGHMARLAGRVIDVPVLEDKNG